MLELNAHTRIRPEKIITGRTCVIGQTGSGKSYLVGVLCEELLKNGYPFCIIDTEGEYYSLKNKFSILWAGKEGSDLDVELIQPKKLAEKIITQSIPLIFDVSDALNPEKLVDEFLQNLMDKATVYRKPYLIIIEEADKFASQTGTNLEIIHEIARRGRKRGLGLLITTQRPALVDKMVLSQCNNQIIGRLTIKNDLQAVNQFFNNPRDVKVLTTLKKGEFQIMGNLLPRPKAIRVKNRVTKHVSITPTPIKTNTLKLEEIILELKQHKRKTTDQIIKPKLTSEEVKRKVKLRKKYLFFGPVIERIERVELKHLKLVKAIIRENKDGEGIKEYETYFTTNNEPVKISDKGIKLLKGYNFLQELEQDQITTLIKIIKQEEITSRREKIIIKSLREKGLVVVTNTEKGKQYKPLIEIELVESIDELTPKTAFETESGSITTQTPLKTTINKIINSLNPNAGVFKTSDAYYPVYEIIIKGRKTKKQYRDGLSGEIINSNLLKSPISSYDDNQSASHDNN